MLGEGGQQKRDAEGQLHQQEVTVESHHHSNNWQVQRMLERKRKTKLRYGEEGTKESTDPK